jgi:hypothetical protein
MTTIKQEKTKRLNQAQRAENVKEVHFPDWDIPRVWNRKIHDGYTTLPRTLPIAMQAIDAQCKGQPAGHVLFCLWARSPDGPMVTVENQSTFACEAGFTGGRAVDTWRKRMKHLRELAFIQTKAGASGEFHYVLLINPNFAVESLRRQGKVSDEIYSRFIERTHEIGATTELNDIKKKLDDTSKIVPQQTIEGEK